MLLCSSAFGLWNRFGMCTTLGENFRLFLIRKTTVARTHWTKADNIQGLTTFLNGYPSGVLSVISGYGPTSGVVCADHINTGKFVFIKASGVRDSVVMLGYGHLYTGV